jgi:hypothetical protein
MWVCTYCHVEVEDDWEICWNCTRRRDGAATVPLAAPALTPTVPCVRCGSTQIIRAARLQNAVIGQGRALVVAVDKQPQAFVAKETILSNVHVELCGQCGFIHLVADEPDRLWAAVSG